MRQQFPGAGAELAVGLVLSPSCPRMGCIDSHLGKLWAWFTTARDTGCSRSRARGSQASRVPTLQQNVQTTVRPSPPSEAFYP